MLGQVVGGWGLTGEQKGTIWDEGNVPYLARGGGYMGVHILQNPLNHTLQIGAFHRMQICFNKVDLMQKRINFFY